MLNVLTTSVLTKTDVVKTFSTLILNQPVLVFVKIIIIIIIIFNFLSLLLDLNLYRQTLLGTEATQVVTF